MCKPVNKRVVGSYAIVYQEKNPSPPFSHFKCRPKFLETDWG